MHRYHLDRSGIRIKVRDLVLGALRHGALMSFDAPTIGISRAHLAIEVSGLRDEGYWIGRTKMCVVSAAGWRTQWTYELKGEP